MKLSANGTGQQLLELLRARYSVIYAVSAEETRVEVAIGDAARSYKKGTSAEVVTWSISRGFCDEGSDKGDDTQDPIAALRAIAETSPSVNRFWILRDFNAFMDDPIVRRWLRDLAVMLRRRPCQSIIILAPTLKLPPDLEKDVAVLDWPLPSRQILDEVMTGVIDRIPKGFEAVKEEIKATKSQIIDAAAGLTAIEAENVMSRSIVAKRTIAVDVILDAKREAIRKSGMLEFREVPKAGLDGIGGLEVLKPWSKQRRRGFDQAARDFGCDTPRGVLLVGPPGTGKSAVTDAIAADWQLPLLRLDIGRLMGSLVGESEANWRAAIKLAESLAPCILVIDEIEKALAGHGTDSSGVTTRIVGSMLTWMQEHTSPIYVIGTCNDATSLPLPMLRRFDKVWFVNLPQASERTAIFRIHLAKRKRDPSKFDLAKLVDNSRQFSGAEIEKAVIDALYMAFDAGQELTTAHLLAAVGKTIPLAVTMAESIKALETWAQGRAEPASLPDKADSKQGERVPVLDLSDGN